MIFAHFFTLVSKSTSIMNCEAHEELPQIWESNYNNAILKVSGLMWLDLFEKSTLKRLSTFSQSENNMQPVITILQSKKTSEKKKHFHTNLETQTTLSLTKAHETDLMKLKSKFTFQRNHMHILKEETWRCLLEVLHCIVALVLLSFFWFVSVYFNLETCLHYTVKPHKEYGHHGTLFLPE